MVNATLRPLFHREKDPFPIVQKAGRGPRAGLDGCGKSRPIGIQSPDRSARSESLYRLRYPGPHLECVEVQNKARERASVDDGDNKTREFLLSYYCQITLQHSLVSSNEPKPFVFSTSLSCDCNCQELCEQNGWASRRGYVTRKNGESGRLLARWRGGGCLIRKFSALLHCNSIRIYIRMHGFLVGVLS